MNKLMLVGGNFDDQGGRSSGIIRKMHGAFTEIENLEVTCVNGGNIDEIPEILKNAAEKDFVIWMPNIPNSYEKNRDVKALNHKVILCTSKRNTDMKYSFQELISKALNTKSNILIEIFRKHNNEYGFRLIDPLGNLWYNGSDIKMLCSIIVQRFIYLSSIHRAESFCVKPKPDDVPDQKQFFKKVRDLGNLFTQMIKPASGCKRFLGNASFRCMRGFPSFKKNGEVYVSRRNVDKEHISKTDFIRVFSTVNPQIYYYSGMCKPSVDSPIQLALYDKLPKARYMVHSHVYIKDAPFTTKMIPCGGLEEVDEILALINREYKGNRKKSFYAINLIGHGSIVICRRQSQLNKVTYIPRFIPECAYNIMKQEEEL